LWNKKSLQSGDYPLLNCSDRQGLALCKEDPKLQVSFPFILYIVDAFFDDTLDDSYSSLMLHQRELSK
jgi:hypothetical protein